MEQQYGLTLELYRAVVALVDDRMKEIRVTRQDFDRLEAAVQRLAEAQARTEARMEELAKAQVGTAEALLELSQAMSKIQGILRGFEAILLEVTYWEKVVAYFGPFLRRVRALAPVEMEDQLEPRLSPGEFRDLLDVDMLVTGQPRYLVNAPEVVLAVEISLVLQPHDVERAQRRALLLRRAGLYGIPAVAGKDVTMKAKEEAEARKVLLLYGTDEEKEAFFWDEALADALAQTPPPQALHPPDMGER